MGSGRGSGGRAAAAVPARPRGAAGRYVAKERPVGAEGGAEAGKKGAERSLTPGQCRTHMRRTLAKEFEKIVEGFVKEAKKGSCPHLRLTTELLKPMEGTKQKKGPVARFLEEWKED
jgi:hypothetical protein